MSLGLASGAGSHAAGLVSGLAPPLALGFDLGRPLGVQLHHLGRDAGDTPVPEPARRPGVGLDAVAQLDRHPSGSNAAGHGGGVQVLTPQGCIRRLPPALLVLHLHDIGQQDVVVGGGVAQTRGGVAGMGVDEPGGGCGLAAWPRRPPIWRVTLSR